MYAGHFTQYYDDKFVADLSKKYFDRAAQVETNLQKPLVSIALIELEAFDDPLAALMALDKATSRSGYDTGIKYQRPKYISYLEACALCLRAQRENETDRDASLAQALKKLAQAAEEPSEGWSELYNSFDYDKSRYFAILDAVPRFAEESAQIFQKLSSHIGDDKPRARC
jgi:hypothetical protein